MKSIKQVLLLSVLVALISSNSCKKSNGNGGSNGSDILSIETSPASGSVQAAAPGPDFNLTVTIRSNIPAGGVKLDVIARTDGVTTPFYSTSVNTTTRVNNFIIQNTPAALVAVVEVTATDITNPSNRAVASYKYSRK